MNENLQFLQALKDVSDEDFNEDMNSISLTGEHEKAYCKAKEAIF
mgnify:CR=1 FL=1